MESLREIENYINGEEESRDIFEIIDELCGHMSPSSIKVEEEEIIEGHGMFFKEEDVADAPENTTNTPAEEERGALPNRGVKRVWEDPEEDELRPAKRTKGHQDEEDRSPHAVLNISHRILNSRRATQAIRGGAEVLRRISEAINSSERFEILRTALERATPIQSPRGMAVWKAEWAAMTKTDCRAGAVWSHGVHKVCRACQRRLRPADRHLFHRTDVHQLVKRFQTSERLCDRCRKPLVMRRDPRECIRCLVTYAHYTDSIDMGIDQDCLGQVNLDGNTLYLGRPVRRRGRVARQADALAAAEDPEDDADTVILE